MSSVNDLAAHLLGKINTIKSQALLLDYIKGPNEAQTILQLQDDFLKLQEQMNKLKDINMKQKLRIQELNKANDRVVKLNSLVVDQLLKQQSNFNTKTAVIINCDNTEPIVKETPFSKQSIVPRKEGFTTPSEFSSDEEDTVIPTFEKLRKNSPYFSFFELEPITQKEFCQIPKYMRDEKTTLEKLNWAIRELNKAREKKYAILLTEKENMNERIRAAIREYKEQEIKTTNNNPFIVEKDLNDFTSFKLDKSGLKFMTIFRHCKRIKEVRGNSLTRYVFI